MLEHLMLELILTLERRERMVASLAKEFDGTRSSKGTETVNNLGSIAFELLQCASGDGESHLEFAVAFFNGIQQQLIHRNITLLGDAPQDGTIHEIVVIMRVLADIEKAEHAETVGLMYLEIETKLFHKLLI